MLVFYRKALKAGVMVVIEKWVVDGIEQQKNWSLRPSDNNKTFEFTAPEYILQKYASFFSAPK